jgi:nitrogen fixation NifU-like protein
VGSIRKILKDAGYSEKAIAYYTDRVNVGVIETPDIHHTITGPCGDTIEIYLSFESNVISEAKFHAIGCPGIFCAGAALTSMITGKTAEQVRSLHIEDIVDFLEAIPDKKRECVVLAKRAVDEAIDTLTANPDLH